MKICGIQTDVIRIRKDGKLVVALHDEGYEAAPGYEVDVEAKVSEIPTPILISELKDRHGVTEHMIKSDESAVIEQDGPCTVLIIDK